MRQETDNQIWQEGILRHVPLVGSLYNWLSPVPVEAKAKGRYLNLEEGKLESTEKIYKHHMQVTYDFHLVLYSGFLRLSKLLLYNYWVCFDLQS